MEKAMLDLSKPVQTRDGALVRIICTDATPTYPIVGVRAGMVRCWLAEGRFAQAETTLDLINVPPPEIVTYVNVYHNVGRYGENDTGWSVGGEGDVIDPSYAATHRKASLKITRVEDKITKVELV
jgi:hypothetical protein